MTFQDLVQGDAIFVDANTFVYHFAPDPTWGAACGHLLQRIQNQELQSDPGSNPIQIAEIFRALSAGIFTELAAPPSGSS